jgi:hypothetical protein
MDPYYWEQILRNRTIGNDFLNPTQDMMVLGLLDKIRDLETRIARLEAQNVALASERWR